MTGSNRGLQGLTEGYKGYRSLQWVTGSDTGLEGLTEGYKGLQGVTRG